ncbi:MAG: TonB-dependent receptor [Gammaproteobacteria bacterium]
MRQTQEPLGTKLCVLASSVMAALGVAAAQAQEASPLEEVVVLGTVTGTSIRGVAPVGSQTLTISRESLLESPVRDTAEIITIMPQGSQIGSGVASADGGNDAGNSGINLRGLGTNASLMLLDGHRMVGQGVSDIAADPSMIPFAAIETVEVVLDGASAVYGSDAVAGVVNFIMRDNFEGVDVQLSGLSGPYESRKVELVAGHNFEKLNVMFGFSFEDQGSMMRNERPYLKQDLRPYGGNDNRIGTNPTPGRLPVIIASGRYYTVPENWVGETDPITGLKRPTLEEIQATELQVADTADYSHYIGELQRKGVFARVSYDISDRIELTYTGLFSKREALTQQFGGLTVNITPDSPYYIPGIHPTNPTGGTYQVRTNTWERGFGWYGRPYSSTQNQYIDLRWDIGEWQMNSSVFYGKTQGLDINRPEANNAALVRDPAGTPEGYLNYAEYGNNPEWFNPYLVEPQPGMGDHLIGMTYRRGDQDATGINVRFEGPVANLPAGEMRMSAGAEYMDHNHWLGLDQTVRYYDKRLYWLRDTSIDRQVNSLFLETYVPILADKPIVQRLALSAAVRRDDYSDFGTTTNPKFGLTWDVNDALSVRASYAEAFRAPTLTQINPGVNSTLTRTRINVAPGLDIPITDPVAGQSEVFTRGGRTPTLGPETAELWSIGIDIQPLALDGLKIGFTYYEIDYTDRIEPLPNWQTALSSAENRRIYAPYIHPYTQPANCVDGDLSTYNPILTQWLNMDGTRFAGGPGDCQTVAVIDIGDQNVGSVSQRGYDFQASYRWNTDVGTWQVSTNVAKILDLKRTLIHGGEWFDVLDRIGWQTSLRATARLSWLHNNWNAALTARHEGSYWNDQTPRVNGVQLPHHEVPSWTTYDLVVAYRAPEDGAWWSGVTASLGVQNLFDKDPPIVLNGTNAIDTNVHNPFGRMYRFELGKKF